MEIDYFKKLQDFKQKDCLEIIDTQIEKLKNNREFYLKHKESYKGDLDKCFDIFMGGEYPHLLCDVFGKRFIFLYLFQEIEIPFKLLKHVLPMLEDNDVRKIILDTIKQEIKHNES